MDRQNRINIFITALEGLSNSVIPKSFEISERHLGDLVEEIITYINFNYPTIQITTLEIKKLIDKVYQEKHYNLKKSIDSGIGMVKYDLEDINVDIESIFKEEISKYKTLFTSVKAGTNINYLGLVNECTRSVMGMFIRRNNTISFAKRTEEINDYIFYLVNDSFHDIMVELGDYFISHEVSAIEENIDLGKSKVKTEEFL